MDFGRRLNFSTDRILAQVNFVREVLMSHGIDPEEVTGEINPDASPYSCY